MNIFSVFDGISCGYLACQRANIPIDLYFASEIDEAAIKVSKARTGALFDRALHLGGIEDIDFRLMLPRIDLFIGGSPCQGFSKLGDGTNFKHYGSKLFYEYIRLLKYFRQSNSKLLFLLENVQMRRDWVSMISKELQVEPMLINSNLVSAQNRPRLYWTNIPGIKQPRDRKVFFPNIAEYGIPRLFKKIIDPEKYFNLAEFQQLPLPLPVNFYMRRTAEAKRLRSESFRLKQGDIGFWKHREFFPRLDLKVNCILTKYTNEHFVLDEDRDFRRLTPLEIERAQTLPDGYTDNLGLSESKRIELIGNAWTVDVISHILSFIKL